jgi:uncharacterized protein YbaR (Trm112 family)
MAKRTRPRTERRERERAARRLVHDRERLFALEPGGSPEHPIVVDSPSVIPVRARALPCPQCGGTLDLDEETAERVEGRSLRAAHLTCRRCGVARRLWFRLGSPGLN